jgi:hypothetical protein
MLPPIDPATQRASSLHSSPIHFLELPQPPRHLLQGLLANLIVGKPPGTIVWTSDWGIRHHLSVWPNLEKYGTTLNEYRIPLVAHQQPHFENSATPRFRGRSLGPETQINLKRQSGVGRAVRRTRRFKVRKIYEPYSNIPAHRNWQIETADWIWPASSSVV